MRFKENKCMDKRDILQEQNKRFAFEKNSLNALLKYLDSINQ